MKEKRKNNGAGDNVIHVDPAYFIYNNVVDEEELFFDCFLEGEDDEGEYLYFYEELNYENNLPPNSYYPDEDFFREEELGLEQIIQSLTASNDNFYS